jgi:hypothetical protein
MPHVFGEASTEDYVQDAAARAKTSSHPVRRVVIEVVFLHVAEVGISKIVVVGRMMDPLFSNVGLESASDHHRSGERRKEKNAQGSRHKQEWQHIAELAAHVITIKRSFVVSEVKRVKILIRQARETPLVPLLRYCEVPMQDITM